MLLSGCAHFPQSHSVSLKTNNAAIIISDWSIQDSNQGLPTRNGVFEDPYADTTPEPKIDNPYEEMEKNDPNSCRCVFGDPLCDCAGDKSVRLR